MVDYRRINKHKSKEWTENNKERMKELQANWYQKNKPKVRQKYNNRYQSDPLFKMKKNYSRRLSLIIQKDKPTLKYLGVELSFLKKWFEFCFKKGYSFENYGSFWHIDHVIPVNKWNLDDDQENELCFSWYNLSPLKGDENISKHDKIIKNQLKIHAKKLSEFCKMNDIEIPPEYSKLLAKHLAAGNPLSSNY